GLFTEKLKGVWADGGFDGNYAQFVAAIAAQMPTMQTPNYFPFGREDAEFVTEQPFSVAARGPGAPAPTPVRPPAPPTSPGVAGDNQRLLIEAYLRLLDVVGAPAAPGPGRAIAPARTVGVHHLVYVHGIAVHVRGYSDAWWQAMQPYTDVF